MESEDEKIKEQVVYAINQLHVCECTKDKLRAWVEKQGQKDSQVKLLTFTFDDILALQCCMETVKKVQEDKELYEKLNDLHGRVYDAYHLEKQGEQKQNPYSGTSFVYNGHTWGMCGRDNGVDVSIDGVIAKHISADEIEQIYTKTAMLDCHTCANYNVKCEPEKNKFICEYLQKKSQNILEKEYYSTPKKGL